MNKKTSILALVVLVLSLSFASVSEARLGGGGGRSSGSRGSRGFTPRSAQPSQGNYSSSPLQQPRSQPQPMGNMMSQPPMQGGGFMRGMMGGIAGGFLGSMLFRGMGYGGGAGMPGEGGGGGFGIFEIVVLAGLGFLLFRMFAGRRPETGMGGGFQPRVIGGNSNNYADTQSEPAMIGSPQTEASVSDILQRFDTSFDLRSFKEERMDDFFKLQAAWGTRDLTSIYPLLAPEIRQTLDADLAQLKSSRRINRIENIAVRENELVEAWQEYGKEFATLRFKANLVDYTVDESTNAVVEGDRTQPVKFEEQWTFVRNVGDTAASNPWKLSAIQ